MKVRVIKDAFYNLEYIKGSDNRIIEYKGDEIPSWAEPVKEKNKNKNQEANKAPKSNADEQKDVNKAPEVNTPELNDDKKAPEDEQKEVKSEKQEYLDLLLDEAIDKNILIEDADKKTVDEQIAELEEKLGKENKQCV